MNASRALKNNDLKLQRAILRDNQARSPAGIYSDIVRMDMPQTDIWKTVLVSGMVSAVVYFMVRVLHYLNGIGHFIDLVRLELIEQSKILRDLQSQLKEIERNSWRDKVCVRRTKLGSHSGMKLATCSGTKLATFSIDPELSNRQPGYSNPNAFGSEYDLRVTSYNMTSQDSGAFHFPSSA